jgi:cellulose synthase/poly-beta-1,6-N-acetylglucosamine synthase-like glycosyltransferase
MSTPSSAQAPEHSRVVVNHEELVTIAVPARNEERFIGHCLDSLSGQTHRNVEILVVDSASTDGTREVVLGRARDDGRIRLLSHPGASIPGALNAALAAARGRWFVRVDAHATVPEDYVSGLVRHLGTGRWGGVGGRKDGTGITPAGVAIAAVMGSRFGVGNSWYHHATSSRPVEHIPFGAYPTSLLRSMNGWDETISANEDFELDYRLRKRGHALLLDPSLVIRWNSRQTVGELFRQYRRYGRGKATVAMLHPGSLLPRHLMPPALVAATVVGVGLGIFRPRLTAVLLSPYVLCVGAASALVGGKLRGWPARSHVPAAFLAMHYGWGIGFLEQLGRRLMDRGRRPSVSAKRRIDEA